jgi:hypothetical protein
MRDLFNGIIGLIGSLIGAILSLIVYACMIILGAMVALFIIGCFIIAIPIIAIIFGCYCLAVTCGLVR